MSTSSSPTLRRFETLRRLPLGRHVFDLAVATFAPFNAVLGVKVEELAPGLARTSMRDAYFRRNHLRTVHAVALTGLAEVTGNLAVASLLAEGQRFVVRSFEIDFERKARGALRAECALEARAVSTGQDVEVSVAIYDAQGERVASARSVVAIRGEARRAA